MYRSLFTINMYDYTCIEMKNVHNATLPMVFVRGTIAESRIDENNYNVMRQLVESNFVVCLFE